MNATENDSLNRPFVVFNEANLENIIDISYLETEPDKINAFDFTILSLTAINLQIIFA